MEPDFSVDYSPDYPYSGEQATDIDEHLRLGYTLDIPEPLGIQGLPEFEDTKSKSFDDINIDHFTEADKANAMQFGIIILLIHLIPKML